MKSTEASRERQTKQIETQQCIMTEAETSMVSPTSLPNNKTVNSYVNEAMKQRMLA